MSKNIDGKYAKNIILCDYFKRKKTAQKSREKNVLILNLSDIIAEKTTIAGLTRKGWQKIGQHYDAQVILPAKTKKGNPFKKIGEKAFCDLEAGRKITSLYLPELIEEIEDYAFEDSGLTTVKLPLGLKKIGFEAFRGCFLQHLCFPESLEVIEARAFFGQDTLEHVIFPKSLQEIKGEAFAECKALKQISLKTGLEKIGAKAFYHCPLDQLILPASLKSIGHKAFKKCPLQNLKLNEGLEIIEAGAFAGTPYTRGQLVRVKLPQTLKVIGRGAFAYNQMTDLVIPAEIKDIQEDAFKCNELVKLVLNAGLIRIGGAAFAKNKLQEVILPESLEAIQSGVRSRNKLSGAFQQNQITRVKFGKNIKKIGMGAFANNQICGHLEIPKTVIYVGAKAFYQNQITSINIPEDLAFARDSIGDQAWQQNGSDAKQDIMPHVVKKEVVISCCIRSLRTAEEQQAEARAILENGTSQQHKILAFKPLPQDQAVALEKGQLETIKNKKIMEK